MRLTYLGWAGVELEHGGQTVVIDPLHDAATVFARFVGEGSAAPIPVVTAASPGTAVVGLVTHLHRDHADAGALAAALAPGAELLEPQASTGDGVEAGGLAQANAELTRAGLARRALDPWQSRSAGHFTITAVPAVDGTGDPQVSWVVEAGGVRVLHLGDTTYHGGFWSIARRLGPFDLVALPVNGAIVSFPHRQPASPFPIVMDPEQAASAAHILGARLAVPIHAEGYEIEGLYTPMHGAAERFVRAARGLGVSARELAVGASVELSAAHAPEMSGEAVTHGMNH